MTPTKIYERAAQYAAEQIKDIKDTGYGCGTSFVTIKWGTFTKQMKDQSLAHKDGYHGWILETNEPVKGTLEQESYNTAFARYLNDHGIPAFVRTYLN